MNQALQRAIDLATSQTKLAAMIGGSVKQQHISLWLKNGIVPPDQVLGVARAVNFRVTPHQLDPSTYPYPSDGLPLELRERAAA